MKKFLVFLIAAIISSTFIESCKRYEDGPDISFRSAKKRLQGGYWKFNTYMVNGIDSSFYFRDSSKCYVAFYFDKDIGQEIEFGFHEKNYLKVNYGVFSFINHKRKITTTLNMILDAHGFGPFFQEDPVTWQILRLTKDELWITTVFNSYEYLIKMYKADETF